MSDTDRTGRKRRRGILVWLLSRHNNTSHRHCRWQQLRDMARR